MMLREEAEIVAARVPLELPWFTYTKVTEGGAANGVARYWVDCYTEEPNPGRWIRAQETYYSTRTFAKAVTDHMLAEAKDNRKILATLEWRWIFDIMQFTMLRYRHWFFKREKDGQFYSEKYGRRAMEAAIFRDVRQKFKPKTARDFALRRLSEGPGFGRRENRRPYQPRKKTADKEAA